MHLHIRTLKGTHASIRTLIYRDAYTETTFCVRFCPDFDLCATCEAKEGVHDPTHILLKLNVPVENAQIRYSTVESLLTRTSGGCGVESDGRYILSDRSGFSNTTVNILVHVCVFLPLCRTALAEVC